MGLRIDVSVILWIQLPVLRKYFRRLTSRFFINLRYIAFHQQQTALGPRAVPSTLSAPRVHTAWKQSGRPMTDSIVDLPIVKTSHNNKTYPNEGVIRQEEVLQLKVLRSQNQRNGGKHDSGIMSDIDP